MKVLSLSITNILNLKEQAILNLDNNFNVLIGPNGGGKTNLLHSLISIIRYFYLSWNIDIINKNNIQSQPINLTEFLKKNFNLQGKDVEISIKLNCICMGIAKL